MWLLVMNAVALACVVAAGVIALMGLDGWGWFLVVALLTSSTPSRITVTRDDDGADPGVVLRRDARGVYRPDVPPPSRND